MVGIASYVSRASVCVFQSELLVQAFWFRCVDWGVGSDLGLDVGSHVGSHVFDDRDVNVLMADTKIKSKDKNSSSKFPGGPYRGTTGFLMYAHRQSNHGTRLAHPQPRLVYDHSARQARRLLSVLCEALCMSLSCYWSARPHTSRNLASAASSELSRTTTACWMHLKFLS